MSIFARGGNSSRRRSPYFRRPLLESLELRRVLTSNLYIDFGDAFTSNTLTDTVANLKASPVNGLDFQDLDGTINNSDNFTITAYNTALGAGATKAASNRANIIALVQQEYAMFDIRIVPLTTSVTTLNDGGFSYTVSAANSLADVATILQANDAEAGSKKFDAFMFVGGFSVNGNDVASTYGFGGQSPLTDINALANTRNDTSGVFVGANDVWQFTADTIAHEAGHDFGLQHAFRQNPSVPVGALGAAYDALHESDMMSYLSYGGFNQLDTPLFSRFPLVQGDGNTNVNLLAAPNSTGVAPFNNPTAYDQLANDPSIGPSALSYVSGTGANDIITITRSSPTNVHVTVQPFANSDFTSPIVVPGQATSTFAYDIPLTALASSVILVDGGARNDRIIVDATLGDTLTVLGGNDDGTAAHGNDADELVVMGNNVATANYSPSITPTGTLLQSFDSQPRGVGVLNYSDEQGTITAGGTTINFSEFDSSSKIAIQDVGAATFKTVAGVDLLSLTAPVAGQNRVSGSMVGGTVAFVPLDFFNVPAFTIDTSTGDTATGNDVVAIAAPAQAALLTSLAVKTGAGNDKLILDFTSGNMIPSAGLSFDAGTGANDSLTLVGKLNGAQWATEHETPTGAHAGTIDFTDPTVAGTRRITYQNLTPIIDTATVTNFIKDGTAAGEAINLIAKTGIANVTSEINSGASGTFELIDFGNKANVFINGLGGVDSVNVGSGVGSLQFVDYALSVDGGGDVGDSLLVDDSGENSTRDIPITSTDVGANAPTVAFTLFNQLTGLNYSAFSSLKVNTGSSIDIVNIASTSIDTTLFDQGATDSVFVGSGTMDYAGQSLTAATLDTIAGQVHIIGKTGAANSLFVLLDDSANDATKNFNYDVTPTGISSDPSTVRTFAGVTIDGAADGTGSTVGLLSLRGTQGDNIFNVTPSVATSIKLDGQAGTNTLSVSHDFANFTLTNSLLSTTGSKDVTLVNSSFQVANLTGGASANTFDVSGWTGTGAIDGLGDVDTIVATKDEDFTATDALLKTTDGMSLTLSSIETLNLTGGTSENKFHLTPSATATYNIAGLAPTFGSGVDSLDINFTGTTGAILTYSGPPLGNGSWTFANRMPINFTGIESPVTLKGNVTARKSGSVLTVIGDNQSNGVSIFGDSSGHLTVLGFGTTVNGLPVGTFVTYTGVKVVVVSAKSGNDLVQINQLNLNALTVVGEAGNDFIDIANTTIRDAATIDGGAGDDSLAVMMSTFRKALAIVGGSGANFVSLTDSAAKVTSIVGGNQVDNVNVARLTGHTLEIVTVGGNDVVSVSDTRISDTLHADLGSGNDGLTLTNDTAKYALLYGGPGSNTLAESGNTFTKLRTVNRF